jgi:sulfite reductase (NADPH) flavoprotein alpha-component
MAQLDCGACGYLCKTYSEAIATGAEKDLSRCTPGGKDTSKKLKELVVLYPPSAANAPAVVETKSTIAPNRNTHDRNNPAHARLVKCAPLNQPGSAKDTRHVIFDLKNSGLSYKVGDALGIFAENCSHLVQQILDALGFSGAEEIHLPDGSLTSLREAMIRDLSITRPSPAFLELLASSAANSADGDAIKAMITADDLPDGIQILDLLLKFPSARPSASGFAAALSPLQPRLYSISSSLLAHPNQVHLTVGVVRYKNSDGRECGGVASTYLADRIRPGQKVRAFVQPAHRFGLPANGQTPIIMVGPGTGIAPFRAFLQERKALSATGKNWLLFGDQRSATDFLFEDELRTYHSDGLLTRLETAFSRDQAEKIYVQHRMLEHGGELWNWLQEGAHFYVCGDAKRMAADVDQALKTIISTHGNLSAADADAYVAELTKAGRYQRDVY